MRPVDIEADVKEMERRKRVEAIMNSQVDGDGGDDQDDESESSSIISLNISFLPEAEEEVSRCLADCLDFAKLTSSTSLRLLG